ncbi:MAG: hypothetical protein AAF570_20615, partial [Bacteroidota bacterium]
GCDKGAESDGTKDGGENPITETGPKGLKLDNMDQNVSPRENFFLYTNGGYLNSHEIPPEESSWGRFQ